VERFFATLRGTAASSAHVDDREAARMVAHARRLVSAGGCSPQLLTRRIARRWGVRR